MRKNTFLILLAILLVRVPSAAQQQDGSVFERRVTIDQTNQPLSSVLDQISWQAGVYFSYNATILNADKKTSVYAENKSLFTVLNQLFNPAKYKLSELKNQIIISQIETNKSVKNDTIPIKYFFLSGKITDKKKGTPIRYATISIAQKPIGTISNYDGDFLLKVRPENMYDTVVISCMGYGRFILPAYKILDEDNFLLNPISIRIKEVKVTATTPHELLKKIRENIQKNYSDKTELMTAFYRETIQQDNKYISVSEAVMEVLKAPYTKLRNDVVKLIKGRKSPDVQPIQWINLKLQGGPFSIVKLDIVKRMERFIEEDFEPLYEYKISDEVWYKNYQVYVLEFRAVSNLGFPNFTGKLFVDRETFAIVFAEFKMNKNSLREAKNTMIRKKPSGVKAKISAVEYRVSYQKFKGKWHLATARSSIKIKVKSRHDKINSEFKSVSDMLITTIQPTQLKRFKRNESFSSHDIFVEMIDNYDEQFWGNYNIIKPNENLRNAFKNRKMH